MMKIVAIKEKFLDENRVAITPDVASLLIKKGYKIIVEKDLGIRANFSNILYKNAGAEVLDSISMVLADADIILKVQPTPLKYKKNEVELAKKGACIIGLLSPQSNSDYIKKAHDRGINTIAMELVPRISKTQNMDALSSQNNISGYRAVIEAAYHFNRGFPMLMTSAGTINPCKMLVLGIGVSGLQAIATGKRLGASVSAYDIRKATKEQVESLGAKFVFPNIQLVDSEDKNGYAQSITDEFEEIQNKFLLNIVPKFNIIITNAQIPGTQAPVLVNKHMIDKMESGSIVIDMATATGGNVSDSQYNQIIVKNEVKIIGCSNFASKIPFDASRLYSKNLYNFLVHLIQNQKINYKDEIVNTMLITK